MYQLTNDQLRLELLDPTLEKARLGPRFCAGGYIWQVHDHGVGPLLTGPEWPELHPVPANGQGLPESFRHSTTTGAPLLWAGPVGLAPGAGALARAASGAITLTEHCVWDVSIQPHRAVFRTTQSVNRWSYGLERTIELHGRQVRSHSLLTNHGAEPLVLEWFAHPFFALQADGKSGVTLPTGTQLADNPGYQLSDRELTLRRPFIGTYDGHLEVLGLVPDQIFSARLTHPRLSNVNFATDFVPLKAIIWANGNTLSLEPFLDLRLPAGETREWTLTYDFGLALG